MAYLGKTFKKFKFENIDEFFDKNNFPEKFRLIFKNTDSLTRYEKNDDGTIQFITTTKDGEVKVNHKLTLNTESDFVTPDGITGKVVSRADGNSIIILLTLSDGFTFNIRREYENNTLKQTLYKDNDDVKAIIYYEEV